MCELITMLKRGSCLILLTLVATLLCLHSSSSAKVHSGTWKQNTKWYYDTKTKTITIDCKGKMADDFADHGEHMEWHKWYIKARKVVFKKGITYIGGGSFINFQNLEEVVLPEGLETIGAFSFADTYGLKRIKFPSTVKRINYGAFSFSGLRTLCLQNVEWIGRDAFIGTNIKKVTIPPSCKTIKGYSFRYCSKLKRVEIENGLKVINAGMFCGSGVEEVVLPASVTKIGAKAFYWYSSEEATVKRVTINSTKIKKWGKNIFGKARKDLVIRVPKSKKKEYTKALREGGLPEYVKIVGK